jgi:ribonuclease VapC
VTIDTSAIIAIIFEEADREEFLRAMTSDSVRIMSAATLFEAAIVIDGVGDSLLSTGLDNLVLELDIQIIDLTVPQVRIAREAYRSFGKGSGHPAQLNFGNCFAYALAIEKNEPLLFKGNDFNHTDVRLAIPAGQ